MIVDKLKFKSSKLPEVFWISVGFYKIFIGSLFWGHLSQTVREQVTCHHTGEEFKPCHQRNFDRKSILRDATYRQTYNVQAMLTLLENIRVCYLVVQLCCIRFHVHSSTAHGTGRNRFFYFK